MDSCGHVLPRHDIIHGGGSLLANNNALAESAADADASVQADGDGAATTSNGAEVKVDVTVTSMLSLAAYPVGDHTTETDQVALNPIPGAGLATNMLDLVVRTNVETGYQLSIRDKDTSAALVSVDDPTRTIPTLTTNTNTAGFPDNYWGYSVGSYNASNSEFYGVPTDAPTVIAQSDKLLPGDGETTTVTFGAKVNSAVAEGLYEDIVLFTASPKLLPATYNLTIHYRYEDGSEAKPDYTAELGADAEYSVTSPTIDGYYPSQDIVTGRIGNEDVEITVTYSQFRIVTVKYVYEDGTQAGTDVVKTGLKPGDTYNIPTPALAGYYPDIETVSGTVGNENIVETVTYKKFYTATVKFVDEAGTEIATAQSKTNLKTGDSYSFDIPEIAGYYTDETSPITGTIKNGNVNKTVTYKKYYTATVTFKYEDGSKPDATETKTNLKNGDSYSFTIPAVSGYYADKTSPVSGTISGANVNVTVTYKKYRTMTIKYQTADGTTVKASTTQTNLKTGDSYSVTSPTIDGYTANQATYTGTVPANDFTVTVLYTPIVKDLHGITTMQELTTAVCNATTTPTASATTTTTTSTTDTSKVPENTLKDTRDNKTYKVRKLADGKCWMVQDLNYTLSTSKALTPADSDVPSNWTPNNNTQTSTGTTWETPSATTARSYTNGARTYYNWYAATGGTTNASTTSGNASGSVCPKGWTLPTSSEYSTLTTTYGIGNNSAGSTKLQQSPLGFVYTGLYDYNDGSLDYEGSDGYYWSRTANSGSSAYALFFNSSNVFPQNNSYRGYGFALRCVGR